MGRAHNRDRSDGYWFLAIGARDRGLKASPLSLPDPSMRFLAEFRGLHFSAFSIRPPYAYRKAASLVPAASLGLIAFNIGSHLTVAKLRAIGMSLIGLALAQLVAPLLAVLGALTGGGFPLPTALIIAAVAPVTAPTTTYAVIERRNATGPFVDRALGVLAINDAATILIF